MKNVQLKEGFSQVCVWPGTLLGNSTIEDFEFFMKNEFNVDIQYLEEIKTKPDMKNNMSVSSTGGRNDLFFAVKDSHISRFSVPRLEAGIRWIEDMLSKHNHISPIYPERVFDYCSCNKESLVK